MKTITTAFAAITLVSAYASADCTAPTAPTIPDGSKSTLEQMLTSKTAIANFQAENTTYRDCVSNAIDAAKAAVANSQTPDEKARNEAEAARQATIYNQAVDSEEALAGQFNAAIKAYKAANPG